MENIKNVFASNDILIRPTYKDYWVGDDYLYRFITIENTESDEDVSLDLDQARFVIESLQQIVDYAELEKMKKFKIGDVVRVVKGRMEGLVGQIKDMDKVDKVRPVYVQIYNTNEIENCAYFCHYDELEKTD